MRKIVLTFGLIAGAILSVMLAISLAFHEQIGFDRAMVIGYTTMVLAFLMIYFGVRSYRDNVAGGQVSFGRAFTVGFLIMLVASACYVATWEVIYFNFIPDHLEKYAEYSLEKERLAGATVEQLAAREAEMAEFREMYRNPLVNIAVSFLEPLPVGLLFTVGTALALGRKRRMEQPAVPR